MAAKSKRAEKIKRASGLDLVRLAAMIRPPKQSTSALFSWDLTSIRQARDAQLLGNFALPAKLAQAMRTDDAVFAARKVRLAPQRGLPRRLKAANDSARAKRIASEGEALFGPDGVGISPGTIADINGCLADHGIAVAYNVVTPRDDGSRIDLEVHYWPIEFVRWDVTAQCLMTRIEPGSGSERDQEYGYGCEVPIVHGDGRWIVFSNHEYAPWTQDAAVLACLLWGVHAFAWRDWSKGSKSHGDTKTVVTPPEGVATSEQDGAALLAMVAALESGEDVVGIKPFGAEIERLTDTGTAWQIYQQLIDATGRAWSRVYNGQDGAMGSSSSAPGVSLEQLFHVASDIVEGDLTAIDRGLNEGAIQIWTALNFGDSSLAPDHEYVFPNADEDASKKAESDRGIAFFAEMKAAQEAGFVLTPEYVADRAEIYGIRPPMLKSAVAAPAPAPVSGPAEPTTPPVH